MTKLDLMNSYINKCQSIEKKSIVDIQLLQQEIKQDANLEDLDKKILTLKLNNRISEIRSGLHIYLEDKPEA